MTFKQRFGLFDLRQRLQNFTVKRSVTHCGNALWGYISEQLEQTERSKLVLQRLFIEPVLLS